MANPHIDVTIKGKDETGRAVKSAKKGMLSLKNIAETALGVGVADMAMRAGTALFEMGKSAVMSASMMEQQNIAFQTLLGSASEAEKVMARIKKEAKTTPFQLEGLTRMNQLLIGSGLNAEKAMDTVLELGDVLSAVGKGEAELTRIGNTISQVFGKGKADAVDFKELVNAGWVTVREDVAETMGVTVGALNELVSEGKVGFDELSQTLERVTGEGGRFSGAMESQSQTFAGQMSNIKDSLTLIGAEIGKAMLPMLKKVASGLLKFADFISKSASAIKKFLSTPLVKFMVKVNKSLFKLLTGFGLFIKGFKLAKKIVDVFAKAWKNNFLGIQTATKAFIEINKMMIDGIIQGVEWMVNRVIKGINKMINAYNIVGDKMGKHIDKIEQVDWSLEKLLSTTDNLTDAQNSTASSTKNLGSTMSELDEDTQKAIDSIHEINRELGYLAGFADDATGLRIEWEKQNKAVEDAKKSLAEATAKYGENSEQVKELRNELTLEEIQLRKVETQNKKTIAEQISGFEALLENSNSFTEAEIHNQQERIKGMLESAMLTDIERQKLEQLYHQTQKSYEVKITAKDETGSVFSNVLAKIRSIPRNVSTTISTGYSKLVELSESIEGRASGGSVLAGTPYIVGEQGAELFVPNQSGQIINHNTTKQLGGNTINVFVQGGDPDEIVDTIRMQLKNA